ncbi:MAG: AbrB/MazE/SpoVT family DNA-binding domain-containing protein [Actinomycetales bacterium]|jgi:SpoVT / AbrB like domain.|nr:AbrB/MazE/SpoVT family DNA-binding domain-containing protein [Actinomycetales bacterium]
MGDRGRLVIPLELRQHAGLTEGTALILVETDTGIVVMTRTQAREHLRRQLAGTDLVAELLADRRRAADAEDAA